MNAKNITKQDVVDELRRLQNEGHSMKINDFPSWLKYEIRKHFGGYKNAQKELGITPAKRKDYKYTITDAVRNRIETQSKYTDSDLIDAVSTFKDKYKYISAAYINERAICSAVSRRYGNIYNFAETYGIELPPKKVRQKYSERYLRDTLLELIESGTVITSNNLKELGYRNLVDAIKRHYGTWNDGLKALGFDVEYETPQLNWTKERVKYETLNAIKDGVEPTRTALGKHIRGYENAVNKLFGSFDNVKEYCGISTIYDRPKDVDDSPRIYRARLTTRDGFKREIIRLYYTGCPLNYTAINEWRRHLLDRARELFGTWRDALEYCGFNYGEIAASDNTLSECGEEFEEVLGEILTKLGIKFEKYDHDVLKPDFVLPNGAWIDAKLSEWTDVENTVKRYLPECKELIIVYLQGRKTSRERGYKYKHKAVSAYLLTDKMPYDLRDYYNTRLSEIERRASELQSIS